MDETTIHVKLPSHAAVDELNKLIQQKGATQLSPLQVVAIAKRLGKFANRLADNMRIPANNEFTKLCEANTETKQWRFGPATIKRYSPSCVWTYSDEIVELEARLRAVKKSEQEDGTATKTTPVVDPATNSLFAVSVTEEK